ncbi:hypothetical protein ACH4PE_25565 [Amycolatopsis lurida]|uniref:hypothetical protein n=1 Tax=Amycolatopsis lurida TaxID=31959 RepID=UPI001F51CEBD|nr:hypothetical protein [Amycolatopsis lurida]
MKWPDGARVIIRRERPHPGAQLRFTDTDRAAGRTERPFGDGGDKGVVGRARWGHGAEVVMCVVAGRVEGHVTAVGQAVYDEDLHAGGGAVAHHAAPQIQRAVGHAAETFSDDETVGGQSQPDVASGYVDLGGAHGDEHWAPSDAPFVTPSSLGCDVAFHAK